MHQDMSGMVLYILIRQVGMVNVVDIVAPIVIALVIAAVSFYLFAVYCHQQQKGFGNEIFPKILVIFSQTIAWGQILLLPLDLAISSYSPATFQTVYAVIYCTIFVLVTFLNPVAINFYESDLADSFISRFFWSILYSLIVTAIWAVYIFVSYVWVGLFSLEDYQLRLYAPIYMFVAMSLIGWVILAVNGGIGLIYLPKDLISNFVFRPKQLSAEQAFNKKQEILEKSSLLITSGEQLKQKSVELLKAEGGWISRKRNESKFNTLLQKYKKQVNDLDESYEIFDKQLKYKTTHPVFYVLSLVLGIVAVIITIFWLAQILGTMVLQNGVPLFLFVDDWLYQLSIGSASFVSTIIYGIFTMYMQICLIKGNTVFGIRIPYIMKLHPMIVNKTYMNSMLFNCNLMLLGSMSISLLAIWAFPTYLAGSYLGTLSAIAFDNLPIFSGIYGKRIPMIVIFSVSMLTLVISLVQFVWRHYKGKDQKKKEQKQAS